MPGIGHQESSVQTPPRRSTGGAPGERLVTRWSKAVSGSDAGPDRSVIWVSEVLIPRNPWAVEIGATAAVGPPTFTVAAAAAGAAPATPAIARAAQAAVRESFDIRACPTCRRSAPICSQHHPSQAN